MSTDIQIVSPTGGEGSRSYKSTIKLLQTYSVDLCMDRVGEEFPPKFHASLGIRPSIEGADNNSKPIVHMSSIYVEIDATEWYGSMNMDKGPLIIRSGWLQVKEHLEKTTGQHGPLNEYNQVLHTLEEHLREEFDTE